MFSTRVVRIVGDVGFALWCLCGASFVLFHVILNSPSESDTAAGLVVPLTGIGTYYGTGAQALVLTGLLWAQFVGFVVWLTSLALERLARAGRRP